MPLYVNFLGFAAAALTTVAFLPQVLHTYKTKSVDDLHVGTILTFTIGITLWLIYGAYLNSWPMILANGIGLVLQVPLLLMKLRYGKTSAAPDGARV